MSKVSNFDVLNEMANRDMEIALCPDFVGGQSTKKGCHITMGAPSIIMNWATDGKHGLALLAFNKEQFDVLKKELEEKHK